MMPFLLHAGVVVYTSSCNVLVNCALVVLVLGAVWGTHTVHKLCIIIIVIIIIVIIIIIIIIVVVGLVVDDIAVVVGGVITNK